MLDRIASTEDARDAAGNPQASGRDRNLMAASRERIVFDREQFRALLGGRTVAYTVAGMRIEIRLAAEVTWRTMAHELVEAIAAQERPIRDPPEAREFLPRNTRHHR
jgi:hypothetical protein